jgi:uncharacterized protein
MKLKSILSVIAIVMSITLQAQSISNHSNNSTVTNPNGATANTHKDVFDIARKGTVAEMKALMAINKDTIQAINANGFSPLLLACYRGNIEVAMFLIEHVKQIDAISKEGTALTACVFKGEFALAEKLLQKGANPNMADETGITCLMMAIQVEKIELVKLLLQYKADKTLKDKQGKTALDHALFTNNTAIINLLK